MRSRAVKVLANVVAISLMVGLFSACGKKAEKKDTTDPATIITEVTEDTSTETSEKKPGSTILLPGASSSDQKDTSTSESEETTLEPTDETTPTPTPTKEPEETTPEPKPETSATPTPESDPESESESESDSEPENSDHYAVIKCRVFVDFKVIRRYPDEDHPHGDVTLQLTEYSYEYKCKLNDGAEYHSANVEDYDYKSVFSGHKEEYFERCHEDYDEWYTSRGSLAIDTYDIHLIDPEIVEYCD